MPKFTKNINFENLVDKRQRRKYNNKCEQQRRCATSVARRFFIAKND